MVPEDRLQMGAGAPGFRPAGAPGARWLAGWTLLITAVLPAALLAATPLAVLFLWLADLGVRAGFWPAIQPVAPNLLAFLTSFAILLASTQWVLLRRRLPRAGRWFLATLAGSFLGGLAAGLALVRLNVLSLEPVWVVAVMVLPVGLAIGLAHWLYLRPLLPGAFWIIPVDVLAAGSILLTGGTFTGPADLLVLLLPGAITGLGLQFLVGQVHARLPQPAQIEAVRGKGGRLPHLARLGMGAAALVPLFFACSYVYAASQLAMAKNGGIYPSVEEAVIARNSQGWGGAKVVSVENVRVGPNRGDGVQPHVWFGTARVNLDRALEGHNDTHYFSGSFYIHVREGWVPVPEEALPEFVGWVMELYNLEGVRE